MSAGPETVSVGIGPSGTTDYLVHDVMLSPSDTLFRAAPNLALSDGKRQVVSFFRVVG